MYYVINIKGKKYLFLSASMDLIEYNDNIDKILEEVDNIKSIESSLDKYLDRDIVAFKSIKNVLQKQNEIKQRIAACEINVFHGCNLNCRYCFAGQGNHGKTGKMSLDTATELVDFVLKNSSKNQLDITFIGGEPFLNMEAIQEIINYSKIVKNEYAKNVYYSIVTNGTLMTNEISEILSKSNIFTMLSIDSCEQDVNDFLRPANNGESTYKTVFAKSKYLKNNLNINVTVTPFNMNLSKIASAFYSAGVTAIHFSEVISDAADMQFTERDINTLKEEYNKLIDLIIEKLEQGSNIQCYPLTTFLEKIHKRKPMLGCCSVLKNHCAFSPDGKIYPCDMMMFDEYCIGDIRRGFDNEKILLLNQVLLEEGKCEKCWARFLCGGECLSVKLWKNEEQRRLRCILKKHICSLKLYLYDYIQKNLKELILQ